MPRPKQSKFGLNLVFESHFCQKKHKNVLPFHFFNLRTSFVVVILRNEGTFIMKGLSLSLARCRCLWLVLRASECVCLCVWERKSGYESECSCMCVSVCVWLSVWVLVRERGRCSLMLRISTILFYGTRWTGITFFNWAPNQAATSTTILISIAFAWHELISENKVALRSKYLRVCLVALGSPTDE